MAESISRRRSKKAFQRGVAYVVSVAAAGDVDLTLFAGRRAVTRTLKAGEAQLLAHLLTQKRSQSDGLGGVHGWPPYTPLGAFRRRMVRRHQDNPMDLGAPSSLSAVTAGKCQTPLCEGSWVSSPRLSDSAAQLVCSGCGAVVEGGVGLALGWRAQPMRILGDGPEVEVLQCFANRAGASPLTPESALSASQSGHLTLAQRLLALVRCGWRSFWRRSP